jgi:L-asparaginase
MKITFVQGGGTIDKDYPQGENHHGYEFKISKPAFLDIFQRISVDFDWDFLEVVKKDSLDITSEDREKLLQTIQKIENDKIIITHGTDTILETAEVLSKITDKVIILTGAMLPEKFKDSDAMFNLGMSVGAINYLPTGIYIALQGKVVNHKKFSF